MKTTIFEYDCDRFNFREWASGVLGEKNLENIHLCEKVKALNKSPTSSQLSRSFSSIEDIYRSFVMVVLSDKFGEIANYQSPPSFRFHYHGLGSSVFHCDRDFGVEQGRINVWVPLTDVWGDNSLWIESEPGAKNYKPLSMKVGQALAFDGVNIGHGSKINTTMSTRISFDLRFLPGKGPALPASY